MGYVQQGAGERAQQLVTSEADTELLQQHA